MPSASIARTSASVPLATPIACGTPRNAAASCSNASTSGPKMKRPDSRTEEKRSSSSGISGAYCALTSTSGIGCVTRASVASPQRSSPCGGLLGQPPPALLQIPPSEPRCTADNRSDDHVFDVVEGVVEVLPRFSRRVSSAREREAPDRRAREREERVAHERHLEHTRGDGDERPHDRRQPAQEYRPVLPTLEPALRPVEFLLVEMEPAPVALEIRPAAVQADGPPDDRSDRVADRPRERDREVRGQALVDRPPEERDVLVREGTRGERPAVHHDELARGREHGVDEHEREDRVEPVVADDRRDGVGELTEDGGDEHGADCTDEAG